MTEAFLLYERSFNQNSRSLIGKFHTAPTATEKDYKEVHAEYTSTKQALQQMDLELLSDEVAMKTFREACQKKFRQYKKEFQEITLQYNLYSNKGPLQQGFNKQEARLLKAGQNLSEQNDQLIEIKRNAYEADGIAINIQMELRGQTNQLERAINKTKDTQNQLGQSEDIVAQMSKRALVMRIVQYSLVVLIIIALVFIIWYNFWYKQN